MVNNAAARITRLLLRAAQKVRVSSGKRSAPTRRSPTLGYPYQLGLWGKWRIPAVLQRLVGWYHNSSMIRHVRYSGRCGHAHNRHAAGSLITSTLYDRFAEQSTTSDQCITSRFPTRHPTANAESQGHGVYLIERKPALAIDKKILTVKKKNHRPRETHKLARLRWALFIPPISYPMIRRPMA